MIHTRKILPVLEAAACAALAVLLAAGAVVICADGLARRAEDPAAVIYTPEKAAQWLAYTAPLLTVILALAAAGFVMRVKVPGKPAKESGPVKQTGEGKHAGRIRTVFLSLAAILIVLGVLNGSAMDVLIKAIHICSECVGLG